MENRAEENRKNSSTGTGEEHTSDRNRMYLEKLHTETIDLEGRDVEDVLGSIVLEWARRSGLGSGYYPLIGLLELDPETGLKLDLCAPSYAADSCTEPARHKKAGNEDSLSEEHGIEEDHGSPGDNTAETGDVSRDNCGNEDPEEAPSEDSGCSIIRDMLTDMDSMKGMIYAASQMLSLTGGGVLTKDQALYTLQLYCKNATEIVRKWNEFWKNDF